MDYSNIEDLGLFKAVLKGCFNTFKNKKEPLTVKFVISQYLKVNKVIDRKKMTAKLTALLADMTQRGFLEVLSIEGPVGEEEDVTLGVTELGTLMCCRLVKPDLLDKLPPLDDDEEAFVCWNEDMGAFEIRVGGVGCKCKECTAERERAEKETAILNEMDPELDSDPDYEAPPMPARFTWPPPAPSDN